jgi:hypothetical protein
MLDIVCKHHLSGAFTLGHEAGVDGGRSILSVQGGAERASGWLTGRIAELDRPLAVRATLRAAGRIELPKTA